MKGNALPLRKLLLFLLCSLPFVSLGVVIRLYGSKNTSFKGPFNKFLTLYGLIMSVFGLILMIGI